MDLKKYTFVLLFFVFQLNIIGQKEDRIWYFGGDCTNAAAGGAGLDFNSGNPIALINSAMPQTEGSATQSNRNGSILFYTDGVDVFDKTHSIMLNGSGLGGHVSSEQSSLIIPFVNDSTKFYIFAQDGMPTANGTGLHYSIVDITLNGNLGAITATKAVLLQPGTSEILTATKHANGMDYWVITTDFDSLIFNTYKVTQFGISPPIKTNLGFNSVSWANIRFNNKGNKITFCSQYTGNLVRYIADFNLTSGIVSNQIPIDTGAVTDGAEFSPNDSLFYSQSFLGLGNFVLHQYKIFSPNIYASRQLIQSSTYFADFCDFKLAPNGKIYVSKECADSIDVINFPNVIGTSCGFQRNILWLANRKQYAFFPNEIFSIAKLPLSVNKISISKDDVKIYPNPNNGLFTLKIDEEIKNAEIILFNSLGQRVYEQTVIQGLNTINTNNLAKGLYNYILLQDKQKVDAGKLSVE